jgi:hypothetical protein
MGRLIALTAKKKNAESYSTPRVIYVNDDLISVIPGSDGFTKVIEGAEGRVSTYIVFESVMEIEAARNPAATDIYVKNKIGAALSALGANAAAALDLTKYVNDVTGGTTGSADGVQLKAATVGAVQVVINSNTFALDVWPQTGENINGAADDAVYALAANTRKHFVCEVEGEWKVAEDYGA